jgi:hypothetical protein
MSLNTVGLSTEAMVIGTPGRWQTSWLSYSLVPRLLHVLNVAHRERREPGKIYHVRDVGLGIDKTWSVVRANHDSAFLMAVEG